MTSPQHILASPDHPGTPEGVVLAGMRHWARGQAMRSTKPWTDAQHIYRAYLGDEMGEQAIIALARFVAIVGRCAACPLKVYPASSDELSQHEALLLGLIAAIQSGDQSAIDFCLLRLCCPTVCDEVAAAAGVFAFTLKACHKTLKPRSVQQLEQMLSECPRLGLADAGAQTLH